MRLTICAFVWLAALAAAPLAFSADHGCCDQPMACCEKPNAPMACGEKATMTGGEEQPCAMPCCSEHATHGEDSAALTTIDILIAMDPNAILPSQMEAAPVRQTAVVWFHRPVWVGQTVLLGKHVIEHDTDRQARGEPCTHIYAAGDLNTPVATFHCTHLDRDRADKDTVVLQSLPDGMRKLLEFQFAGEHAAHGFPTGR